MVTIVMAYEQTAYFKSKVEVYHTLPLCPTLYLFLFSGSTVHSTSATLLWNDPKRILYTNISFICLVLSQIGYGSKTHVKAEVLLIIAITPLTNK